MDSVFSDPEIRQFGKKSLERLNVPYHFSVFMNKVKRDLFHRFIGGVPFGLLGEKAWSLHMGEEICS